jgi:hypothetical protein
VVHNNNNNNMIALVYASMVCMMLGIKALRLTPHHYLWWVIYMPWLTASWVAIFT